MDRFLKIALLVLIVLPIWLTIVAFGAEAPSVVNEWRDRINSKLLEIKDKKIQIFDLMAKSTDFDPTLAKESFELELSGLRYTGISEIGLKFNDSDGRLERMIRVHARLFIQDEVPVATRKLNPGDLVQADDFRMEWRDASTFRGAPIHTQDLLNRTVRTGVQENEIIYDIRIVRPTLIGRGDHVRISVVGEGINVTVGGIAQEPGSRGQTIKVINNDSRKEIFGVVTDSKTVEVRL